MVVAIWGIVLLQDMLFNQFKATVIPYSDFIKAVAEDRVVEIAIGQDRISGKLKGKEGEGEVLFSTVRVDSDLSQKLAGHNIKFSGQVENTFIKSCCPGLFLFCCFSAYGI